MVSVVNTAEMFGLQTNKRQHLRGLTITDFRPDKHQDGSPRRGQVASQEAGIRRGQESKLRSQQNFSPH